MNTFYCYLRFHTCVLYIKLYFSNETKTASTLSCYAILSINCWKINECTGITMYPFFWSRCGGNSEKSWTHVSRKMQVIYITLKRIQHNIPGGIDFPATTRQAWSLGCRCGISVWTGRVWCHCGMGAVWFGTKWSLVGWPIKRNGTEMKRLGCIQNILLCFIKILQTYKPSQLNKWMTQDSYFLI